MNYYKTSNPYMEAKRYKDKWSKSNVKDSNVQRKIIYLQEQLIVHAQYI